MVAGRRVERTRFGLPFPVTSTDMTLRLLAVLAGSYVLGCFISAYYVTKWRRGTDIRASGSGNAGARNMARVHGPVDAGLTLVLDAAKGAIAVFAGFALVGPEWAAALALCAAIVGHIWPFQLSFHGGKGAATGLGGMLAINPLACLALLGSGAVAFAITRDFFRSGLIAIGIAAPMLALFRHDWTTIGGVAIASFLCLIVNHPVLDAPRQPRPSPPA
jgi:glycerol-3-phosphate acyltransferase PlsY